MRKWLLATMLVVFASTTVGACQTKPRNSSSSSSSLEQSVNSSSSESVSVEESTSSSNENTSLPNSSSGLNSSETSSGVSQVVITFNNWDGNELYKVTLQKGEQITFVGAEPFRQAEEHKNYEFIGWTDGINGVITSLPVATESLTYTAVFNEKLNQYTIKWVDEFGDTIKSEQLVYGTQLVPPTLTKEETDECSYEFDCWKLNGEKVTSFGIVEGNATYTAYFNKTIKSYTITWIGADGIELKTQTLNYGVVPEYQGSTPSKTETGKTYTFIGWATSEGATQAEVIKKVTGNQTYYAVFTTETSTFTVTWIVEGVTMETDTSVLYGTIPTYDGTEPTKAGNAQYSYKFTGWSPSVSGVTQDIVYTAIFEKITNEYTITWLNEDGTLLDSQKVEYGSTPQYNGETPTKKEDAQFTYTFSGWSPQVALVTKDATYTATYSTTTKSYVVTWKNWDGELIYTESYEYGSMPGFTGQTPTRESSDEFTYVFAGWSPSINKVTQNATYTATFSNNTNAYTITWVDAYGDEIKTEELAYGATITAPTAQKDKTAEFTYTFSHWELNGEKVTEFGSVIGNATYTAIYTQTKNKYTIIWLNEDGSELKKETLEYGATPEYDSILTKPITDKYEYSFAGWSPLVTEVTGDATYTATFREKIRTFTVIFKNPNGDILDGFDKVEYGSTVTYTQNPPTMEKDAQYTYTFKGWTDGTKSYASGETLPQIIKNTTFTAEYSQTLNSYTVKWTVEANYNSTDTIYQYGEVPVYPGGTPADWQDDQYNYTFNGWSDGNKYYEKGTALPKVTGDVEYSASFSSSPRNYTITWVLDTTTKTTSAPYGSVPSFNQDTYILGYEFLGWSTTKIDLGKGSLADVTGTVAVAGEKTYYAVYTNISVWDGVIDDVAVLYGSGKQEDPYQIRSADDLAALSYRSARKNFGSSSVYYKLLIDIDLTSNGTFTNWQPIAYTGQDSGQVTTYYSFNANFDGNNKTINYMCSQNGLGFGLFAGIGGYVHDLTVTGTMTTYATAGGLTAMVFNGAKIENVTTKVNITADKTYGNNVGGLFGNISGTASSITIKNCVNTGNITGVGSLGGIQGGGYGAVTIENCSNSGTIIGTGENVAGITAQTFSVNVNEVTYLASVKNCSNSGVIKGLNRVGGIVGSDKGGLIIKCSNTGSITATGTGTTYAGKQIGYWQGRVYTVTDKTETNLFSGSGTSASPFLINTQADLAILSAISEKTNYGSGKYFKLTDDLDLTHNTSFAWRPIAYTGQDENVPPLFYAFNGVFDGNNKTINYMGNQNGLGFGLFAGIGGTVKNLTVKGTLTTYGIGGGLAGIAFSGATIDNVDSYVNITKTTTGGSGNKLGGIVGEAKTEVKISKCNNYGTIQGTSSVGGIVGILASNCVLETVSNQAKVTGSGNNIGGIIGNLADNLQTGITVTSATNDGAISGVDTIGGIQGGGWGILTFTDCVNSGTVTGTGSTIGGIVANAFVNGTSVTKLINCDTTTDSIVSGVNNVGGIVGTSQSTEVTGCDNNGKVTGTTNVGGIAGELSSNATLSSCINNGEVNGTQNVGGIVGKINNGVALTTVTNNANVTATATTSNVAGIVGTITSGTVTITKAINASTATITGNDGVAGIVGGGYAVANYSSCSNLGTLKGTGHVGGIAAYLFTINSVKPTLTSCTANGKIINKTSNTEISNTVLEGTDTNSFMGMIVGSDSAQIVN